MIYIYFDNEADLEQRVEDFKQNISKVLSDEEIDKWTWVGPNGIDYGIQYSCPVEESVKSEILKMTKNQNQHWVDNVSNTIGCAVRAIAFSINCMDKFGPNFQETFKNREICNIMIVKMIIGILFNDDDAGESDGAEYAQLYQMVKFRCCEGEGRYCNCE